MIQSQSLQWRTQHNTQSLPLTQSVEQLFLTHPTQHINFQPHIEVLRETTKILVLSDRLSIFDLTSKSEIKTASNVVRYGVNYDDSTQYFQHMSKNVPS